jgi:predicted nucleotidyltransferase component of viral defense system
MNPVYLDTARLLTQVTPLVFVDDTFALKGGTAINLFVRDMPRLSVDLDLVFPNHVPPRDEALARINQAIRQAAERLKKRGFQTYTPVAKAGETKLLVRRGRFEVKIEVNFVMRGTVQPVRRAPLTPAARDVLMADLDIPVVSLEDMYGGKLVAALDRQHPRDLFDVMQLFVHEGITPGIRRAFVVYLASHNRPVHEVLFPPLRDIQHDYAHNFTGMTAEPVQEVGFEHADRLWVRGGFPKAFLARSDRESMEWRRAIIRSFLERDLRALGVNIAADTMRRFWSMLAHHHAQLWNASEIGRSFGVADTTVRNYLDKLTDALVVRQLKPWHESLGKRQVKSPKIFIRDSGLLHALLNLPTKRDIEGHPKLGASWEGFIIDQLVQQLGVSPEETYHWRTHQGAELDLLVVRGGLRMGFEVKRTVAPTLTSSMRSAMHDLKLNSLTVVHAGDQTFPLSKQVQAVAFRDVLNAIRPLH